MVKITIDSSCTITGTTVDQVQRIKTALTIPNPAYIEAVKHNRYAGKLDKHLHYYREREGELIIPRGFTGQVIGILNDKQFTDNRRTLEPVRFVFTGQLRPYQEGAVDAFENRDFGVLECSTGGGKTVIALALITKRQQPTLIIVHN